MGEPKCADKPVLVDIAFAGKSLRDHIAEQTMTPVTFQGFLSRSTGQLGGRYILQVVSNKNKEEWFMQSRTLSCVAANDAKDH